MAVVVYVPSRLGEGFFTDLPAPTSGDDAKAITYDHDTQAFVYMPFETAGAVATHAGLADPHAQYALESALGTAAALNVGTGANNIVQLNGSAQLPAVDGSLLTGISGGSGTPPGSDTQVIINDGGAYGADPGLTYAKATDRLTVTGGLVAPSMRPASDSTTALQWQNAAGTAFVYGDTTNNVFGVGGTNSLYKIIATGSSSGLISIGVQNTNTAGRTAFTLGETLGSNNAATLQYFNSAFVGAAPASSVLFNVNAGVTGGLFFRVSNGSGPLGFQVNTSVYAIYCAASGYTAIGGGSSPTALLDLAASTTARASLRARIGVRPTSPNDGDLWAESDGWHTYFSGVEYILNMTAA